jgi:hypothetical protein
MGLGTREWDDNLGLDGYLDDVYLYDNVLSDDDIMAMGGLILARNGTQVSTKSLVVTNPNMYSGLVNYFDFEETSNLPYIMDESGYGNLGVAQDTILSDYSKVCIMRSMDIL